MFSDKLRTAVVVQIVNSALESVSNNLVIDKAIAEEAKSILGSKPSDLDLISIISSTSEKVS